MSHTEPIHYFFMALAILLEVAANILIKYSDGFEKRSLGLLGIASILSSFAALSQAIKGIDLSIAYALWGGTGILLTACAGMMLFQQQLNRVGWAGIATISLGMLVLKTS